MKYAVPPPSEYGGAGFDHDHALRQAALAALILEQREEERNRALQRDSQVSEGDERDLAAKVRAATVTPWHWLRNHTRTYNPHWVEEGADSAHEPFPDWPFIPILLDYLDDNAERVKLIEKSRDMLVTWVISGYLTYKAMMGSEREIIVMSQTDNKARQVIDYAKQLWQSQPTFLRNAFPVPKAADKQAKSEFLVGSSSMFAVPAGKGKVRSYHPWAYFSDETAFQPEAGESYDEALPACQKIILNSTANVGWYFDFTMDADRSSL